MRRNWTPSIVPESNDQNVYLVLDDLGRLGRIWPEADAEATVWKLSSPTCLPANTAARFASSHSTLRSAGQETFRNTWLRKYAVVAIYRCASSLPRSVILWNSTRAMIGAN